MERNYSSAKIEDILSGRTGDEKLFSVKGIPRGIVQDRGNGVGTIYGYLEGSSGKHLELTGSYLIQLPEVRDNFNRVISMLKTAGEERGELTIRGEYIPEDRSLFLEEVEFERYGADLVED